MKNKSLFGILPILVSPLLSGAYTPQLDMHFNEFGPFYAYMPDVTLTYRVNTKNSSTVNGYELFVFGTPSNPEQKSYRSTSHKITSTQTSYTVTVPTSLLLGDSGMTITMKINSTMNLTLLTKTITIYPTPKQYFDPTTGGDTFTSEPYAIKMDSLEVTGINEKIRFSNFSNYFYDSTYYKLSLDQFIMYFRSDITKIKNDGCYMKIPQNESLFPGLTYQNGYAYLPLKIERRGDGFGLYFKNPMFVDKKTLIMSDQPRDNFVATNNFYLPINKKEQLLDYPIYFELKNVSFSNVTITWKSKISAYNNLIGDCQNSEYCVEGEVRQ